MAGTRCTSAGDYLGELGKLLGKVDAAAIDRFSAELFAAWRDGRRVLVFGNGGSAMTASHMISDLVKGASVPGQKRLQAIGLSDNVAMLTALANDGSYEDIFIFPLESYAQKGDVAVAISASGNSPNVVKACAWAKEHGLRVVALTGFRGGKVKELADLHINIPSDNYGLVEDLHLSIDHIVSQKLHSMIKAQCS